MASTSLPWHWVIETLAGCKQVNTSILRALISKDPELLTGAPEPVREGVVLRYLEELMGMDRGEDPSEWASTIGLHVNQSCEEVLCREMSKFCQIARLFNLEKDKVNLLTHDLHKFILQKKASLSKSSLDKIKAAILQGHYPALLPFLELGGLETQNEVDYSQCNIGVVAPRADKFEVRVHNTEIQSLRLSSAALASGNCTGLLNEVHPRCMQQPLKDNVADFDKILKQDDVNTGENYQRCDDFIENKRSKKIKLSSEVYHCHLADKNSDVLGPGSIIAISRVDPSGLLQNVLKQNGADDDIVMTVADDVQAIVLSSVSEQPGLEDINSGNFQIPQPQPISACPVPANGNIIMQADSPGLEQHLPDVSNGTRNSPLHTDVFLTDDDHAHLVKDGSTTFLHCNEVGNLLNAPKNRSGENINPIFYEKSQLNVQLSVTSEIGRDDGSYDVPSDVDQNNNDLAAEKHRLLSSRAHVIGDSAIDACTERGLCIKCNNGGELLICGGSGCSISIHETCLGSSPNFQMSGLFYCPFCSYTRAVISYRKAKKDLFQARKVLSAFAGRDFVHEPQRKLVLRDASQTRVVSNSCTELNVGSSWYKGDKPNQTSIEANEQTYQVEDAHACDDCNFPHENAQIIVSERRFDITHNSAEVNDDKIVHHGLTSLVQNANADIRNEVVPSNNDEQVDVAGHQQLGEPHSTSDNIHLTHLEDPCHSRSVHDVGKGDTGMINEHSNVQQLKIPDEEDNVTVDKVVTSEKYGKRREQDASVVNNNSMNMSSPGKSGRQDFRAKRYSNPVLPSGRRTKLSWTTEEEEVLKVAFHKFGEEATGNIPWVRILEYGRHVFHRTRQPGDLKDKWRNMKKKEESASTTTNKT